MNRIVLNTLAEFIDDPVKTNELFKIQLKNNRNLRQMLNELRDEGKCLASNEEIMKLKEENKKLKEENKKLSNPIKLVQETLAENKELKEENRKLKEDNKLQAEMVSLLEGDKKLSCHTCGTWRVDFEDITNHNGNKISLCQDCLDDGDFKECLHCLQYFHSDMIATNHCVWLRGCMACIKKYG